MSRDPFDQRCSPAPVTDILRVREQRRKARLTTAWRTLDAADLKLMLDMLGLWPEQDPQVPARRHKRDPSPDGQ